MGSATAKQLVALLVLGCSVALSVSSWPTQPPPSIYRHRVAPHTHAPPQPRPYYPAPRPSYMPVAPHTHLPHPQIPRTHRPSVPYPPRQYVPYQPAGASYTDTGRPAPYVPYHPRPQVAVPTVVVAPAVARPAAFPPAGLAPQAIVPVNQGRQGITRVIGAIAGVGAAGLGAGLFIPPFIRFLQDRRPLGATGGACPRNPRGLFATGVETVVTANPDTKDVVFTCRNGFRPTGGLASPQTIRCTDGLWATHRALICLPFFG